MTVKEFVGTQSEFVGAENRMTFDVARGDCDCERLTVWNYDTFARLEIINWKAQVDERCIVLFVA